MARSCTNTSHVTDSSGSVVETQIVRDRIEVTPVIIRAVMTGLLITRRGRLNYGENVLVAADRCGPAAARRLGGGAIDPHLRATQARYQ
jgi:hypothetical protein